MCLLCKVNYLTPGYLLHHLVCIPQSPASCFSQSSRALPCSWPCLLNPSDLVFFILHTFICMKKNYANALKLSEKPTSAESVGADSFHGTGNAWRAMAGPKSLAQHVSGITVFICIGIDNWRASMNSIMLLSYSITQYK